MIYLASPYTNPDKLQMKTNFLLAEQATAAMMERGEFVYSPIVHCHALAEKHALPTDFAYWSGYNHDMIRRADAFAILAIPGWDKSKGVTSELDFARRCGMEIYWVDTFGKRTILETVAQEA